MKLVLLALLSLVLLPGTALASSEIESGNSLLNRCHSQSVQSQGACTGFMVGVFDVLASGPVNGKTACPPAGETAAEIKKIALLWLEAHPADRHFPAAGLVATALSEAYPC